MGSLLLLYYNQLVGLPAHYVTYALSITVIFDAFWDPMVGQISDGWRSKWGRRHPFMYLSALPAAATLFMLFNPPTGLGWSDELMVLYMFVMVVLARSTISLYEVPATALTPELAPQYDQRTALLSYRYFFGVFAGSGAAFMGLQLFLKDTVDAEGHRIPGQLYQPGYSPYALAVGVIMIVSILVACLATHKFIPFLHKPEIRRPKIFDILREMFSTLSNRNFLVVTLSALISGMGAGLAGGLSIYFTTFFWKLGAQQLSYIVLGTVAASFIALILAPAVSKAMGKKAACVTMFACGLCISVAPIGLRLIGVIPDSWIGSDILALFLFGDRVVASTFSTCGAILVASMIADVVEESQLKTGRRSEGLLLSADNVLQKIVGALAGIIPGLLLTYVGMPENAKPHTLDPAIMNNLALIYLPCTAAFSGLAIATLMFYRIDRGVHEGNLRRLREAAAAGETAVERGDTLEEGVTAPNKPI
jgi:Na+/melibiose symporter-like transporter